MKQRKDGNMKLAEIAQNPQDTRVFRSNQLAYFCKINKGSISYCHDINGIQEMSTQFTTLIDLTADWQPVEDTKDEVEPIDFLNEISKNRPLTIEERFKSLEHRCDMYNRRIVYLSKEQDKIKNNVEIKDILGRLDKLESDNKELIGRLDSLNALHPVICQRCGHGRQVCECDLRDRNFVKFMSDRLTKLESVRESDNMNIEFQCRNIIKPLLDRLTKLEHSHNYDDNKSFDVYGIKFCCKCKQSIDSCKCNDNIPVPSVHPMRCKYCGIPYDIGCKCSNKDNDNEYLERYKHDRLNDIPFPPVDCHECYKMQVQPEIKEITFDKPTQEDIDYLNRINKPKDQPVQ
jgi:hypothetical protein